ncbi:hypothetical protein MIR68_001640 [Amoeboaphelidium protococcarum]|nr:hypothetical protein MIR68_001640 [Amoeboaphelidium protococcarum]
MNKAIVQVVNSTLSEIQEWATYGYSKIPLAPLALRYVKNSYQNDPFRIILEVMLIIFAIHYMLKKRYYPDKSSEVQLTEKEIDELVQEWSPEPLVPEDDSSSRQELEQLPIIQGPSGAHVKLEDGIEYMNMISFDFLGIGMESSIHESAIQALRKYGVGACGPPGFYGTLDAHLDLEKKLAQFMGTEEAIIYSQAFSTISSVIPAFSKRGDILVVDKGVNFGIQKGVQISRSVIKWFDHNDMDDLERVLQQLAVEEKKSKKGLVRKFIVVEGLYQNFGDIVPLPRLVELKKKYKYRVIMDESMSIGVLGKKGRGVTEHFDIPVTDIEIISGSMANVLSSAGGFCVGTHEVVDHQRLSGLAYCFSAALPAMMAVSANGGVNVIEQKGESLIKKLRDNIGKFRQAFGDSKTAILVGDQKSPLMHLRLNKIFNTISEEEVALQKIVDRMKKSQQVLVTRAKYVRDQELYPPKPSIRIAVSVGHSSVELQKAAASLRKAVDELKLN